MAEGDRLHALDLAWLEMEGDGPPIAIGTVAVAEGPAPTVDDVVALVAERAPRMARLHRELGSRGWGIRRPLWVDGDDSDFAGHVHELSAAAPEHPGLDGAVGWIMQQRLPRDRPLWDAWIVTDLGGNPLGSSRTHRWALVWRVHHSVADGIGALLLIGHGFDVQRDGGATMAERVLSEQVRADTRARPGPGSHEPGMHLPDPSDALAAARRALGHLASAAPALIPHPPGPLTGPVGPGRRWVSQDVALDSVARVRRAYGVTVNDVVLAGVAGGFRCLLEARGEPVAGRSVRNLVPVSLRVPGDDVSANQLGALLVHLPVGVADPVQRLRAVTAAVRHGRAAGEPLLASGLLGLVDRVVPSAFQDPAVASLGRTAPAWFLDTLTTNVPGPPFEVFSMGRAVSAMYPIIPVAGHTAITTGIFSYAGTLNIGVSGDAGLAPDVAILARGIHDAIAELGALAA
jgi:diacylglycerol O-acyltransferase / wax synthase